MPLPLLTETVRSVLLLSDLFYEESQFIWMLECLEEIQRQHPTEDEVLTSLLRLGISKAISVLGRCDQVTIFKTLDKFLFTLRLPEIIYLGSIPKTLLRDHYVWSSHIS